MSATEKSEEEIFLFLEEQFGVEDIEKDPKVGNKKADFRVRSLDTYIEVHALKDVAMDQFDTLSREKKVATVELRDSGQEKILDRIANKLLHECNQLPKGKKNLIITKTEGFFLSPDDVIDAIIGEPRLSINKENMQAIVVYGRTAFRSEEDQQQALQKISAVLAYDAICQHNKLSDMIRNNRNNAEVPFDGNTFAIFKNFLCNKC